MIVVMSPSLIVNRTRLLVGATLLAGSFALTLASRRRVAHSLATAHVRSALVRARDQRSSARRRRGRAAVANDLAPMSHLRRLHPHALPRRSAAGLKGTAMIETFDGFNAFNAEDLVAWALREFGGDAAIASSFGLEDVALIDIASRSGVTFNVFTLDTDFLFPETYALIDRLEQ